MLHYTGTCTHSDAEMEHVNISKLPKWVTYLCEIEGVVRHVAFYKQCSFLALGMTTARKLLELEL